MGEKIPQTYANHARMDPLFHYFLLPLAAIQLIVSIWKLIQQPGADTAWTVVLSVAAAAAVLKIRLYALSVQNRVIRLEERLRLASLVDEPLRRHLSDLTTGQLVGLRFASDAEVPGLVEKALNNNLSNKEIKRAITQWRPDYLRV